MERVLLLIATLFALLIVGLVGLAQELTCGDFETQVEAQRAFEQAPHVLGSLDRDNDGIACEEYSGYRVRLSQASPAAVAPTVWAVPGATPVGASTIPGVPMPTPTTPVIGVTPATQVVVAPQTMPDTGARAGVMVLALLGAGLIGAGIALYRGSNTSFVG